MTDKKSRMTTIFFMLTAVALALISWGQPSQASRFEHFEKCRAFLAKADYQRFNDKFMYSRFEKARIEAFFNTNIAFRDSYKKITGQARFNWDDVIKRELRELLREVYHRDYLAQFKDQLVLEQLRSASLKRSLEAHGYKTNPKLTGQEDLRKLSAKNRKRFIKNIPSQDGAREYVRHPGIMAFLDKMQFNFRRNSHENVIESQNIISSRRLAEYGGQGGLNSERDFNSEFLQQDDNVFFFVRWEASGLDLVDNAAKVYGRHSAFISVDYAREHAMVSYFVMVPAQLNEYGLAIGIDDPDMVEALDIDGGNHTSVKKWQKDTYKFADQIRQRLHEYDFTVDDYEAVIRATLGAALWQKSQEVSAQEFNAYLARLNKDHIFRFNEFQQMEIQDFFQMELKIPVSVPESALVFER